MSTLYWITILGNLNTLGQVLLTILLIVSGATVLYPLIVEPIYETMLENVNKDNKNPTDN